MTDEPTTDAGRELAEWLDFARERLDGIPQRASILAIEQEAVAKYRREKAAEVRRLYLTSDKYVNRAAVLALLGEPNDDTPEWDEYETAEMERARGAER